MKFIGCTIQIGAFDDQLAFTAGGCPMDTAVMLAIVAVLPLTIVIVTGCAIAWRSLTLPPDGQHHVRKLIRLFGQIIRDLLGRGDRRP